VNQRIILDNEIIEFICNENEKSVQHMMPAPIDLNGPTSRPPDKPVK